MSDTKNALQEGARLTGEQAEHVGGGLECTAEQIVTLANNLTEAYEALIDFTSYVMERVAK